MTTTRILSFAATFALAFSALTAATPANACNKGGKTGFPHLGRPHILPVSTVEDLKKSAQAFEAAYNTYAAQEAGKAAIQNRKSLQECVSNSSGSCKKITHEVKIALFKHIKKSKKGSANSKEQNKFAFHEVMQQIEKVCERREGKDGLEKDITPVTNAAVAYFDNMVTVSQTCKDVYAQVKLARTHYYMALKSLVKQGKTSAELKKELVDAGISNPFLLKKLDYLTKTPEKTA